MFIFYQFVFVWLYFSIISSRKSLKVYLLHYLVVSPVKNFLLLHFPKFTAFFSPSWYLLYVIRNFTRHQFKRAHIETLVNLLRFLLHSLSIDISFILGLKPNYPAKRHTTYLFLGGGGISFLNMPIAKYKILHDILELAKGAYRWRNRL